MADAQALYDAGDYERCRSTALAALAENPGDVMMLRLAGRAGVELGASDATELLRQAAERDAEGGEAWVELGTALLAEGNGSQAAEALRRAVDLRPDDGPTLLALGHTLEMAGEHEAAIAALTKAATADPSDPRALRALVAFHRRAGELGEAHGRVLELVELEPDDPVTVLDLAEMLLDRGELQSAADAFRRLRTIDTEHELYALHGEFEAEMRRESWRDALEAALDACNLDRFERTTLLVALAASEVFGGRDREVPERAAVEDELAASRAEHRDLHSEAIGF